MTLEHATVVFLVMLFLAAEIFRAARGTRGVLLSLTDPGLEIATVPVIKARVRLHDGTVIDAGMNFCTACIGQLKIGDEVRVTNSREGYILDLPWFQRRLSREKIYDSCDCR